MRNQKRNPVSAIGKRQWQAHIKALAQSGLSRAEYCRRHGLSYHAMTYWIRQQAKTKENPTPTLVPITLPPRPDKASGPDSSRSELHLILPGKISIAVGDNFSAGTLKRLLATLGSL